MGHYDFSRLRVLVCDDSRPMRTLVTMFLSGFGIKDPVQASDAEDGFKKFLELDLDLIITDWNMSPSSGLDMAEKIRTSKISPNPYIPIIMLTGYTELYRVEQARDVGISGFIAKPVSADSLYRKLVAVVDDHRSFVSNDDYFGPDRRFRNLSLAGGSDRRTLELLH